MRLVHNEGLVGLSVLPGDEHGDVVRFRPLYQQEKKKKKKKQELTKRIGRKFDLRRNTEENASSRKEKKASANSL